ncbi:hypothetical protein FGO68_gene11212 [Halteria grandinella]|uniref:Tubulin/FtsZ GTPase domain-containing protein n=1 Tax=Halteria grandinella TaxID=5974 RepID=A0A8J8T1T8_HALGN|nr:hypothetical protein FGO68_gene11212 [Halteria grandinella]
MKEIISIHLGDLGLNLAQTLWPRFQQETLDFDQTSITDSPFYSEYQSGSVKPRAILCDLDAQNMDYIRMQEGCIFDRDCMINHKDGSGGITVRGKYTTGKEIRDQVLECIRKQTEQCDSVDGFMLYFSPLGGTSGVSDYILQEIHDQKSKCMGVFNVPNQNTSSLVVQMFNFVLCQHQMREMLGSNIVFSNQNIQNNLSSQLKVKHPHLKEVNHALTDMISNLTCGMRFQHSTTNSLSLRELINTQCLYRQANFSQIVHYLPSQDEAASVGLRDTLYTKNHHFLNYKVDSTHEFIQEKIFAHTLLTRGGSLHQSDISSVLKESSKYKQHLGDNLFLYNHTSRPSQSSLLQFQPRAKFTALQNSSDFMHVLEKIEYEFDMLYRYRAFVFWFVGEGMESGEFSECRENISVMKQDYQELYNMGNANNEEEDDDEEQ